MKSGEIIFFHEWRGSITFKNREFLESCEVGQNGNIHLIYDQKEENVVQELFGQDMKKTGMDIFFRC